MSSKVLSAILAASASFFVVTLICAIIFVLCKISRDRRNRTQSRTIPNPDPSSRTFDDSATFDPSMSRISMRELMTATRNFASDLVIGDGSFGLVYKARLPNGEDVAVKKLSKDAFQGIREFHAEMETLGRIRHPNLVRILGYCVSGRDRVLIYEFIEKGNLDQWLYDTSSEEDLSVSSCSSMIRLPLSWKIRTKIIKGVAEGLCFLHNLETPIIHRDIKASNVLLDSNFEAHIADFGLARIIQGSHSHVSTQVAGTMGYMPPEYKDGMILATAKADVFSFGILMIEVATAKRPNWPIKVKNSKEIVLVEWARKMVSKNRELDMIDQSVSKEDLKEAEVKEFLRIACLCTSEISRERPSMAEVVSMLNRGIPDVHVQ